MESALHKQTAATRIAKNRRSRGVCIVETIETTFSGAGQPDRECSLRIGQFRSRAHIYAVPCLVAGHPLSVSQKESTQ